MNRVLLLFLNSRSGATAIEYGLIAALIAVVIIGGASMLGETVDNTFRNVAGVVNAAS